MGCTQSFTQGNKNQAIDSDEDEKIKIVNQKGIQFQPVVNASLVSINTEIGEKNINEAIIHFLQPRIKNWICCDAVLSIVLLIWSFFRPLINLRFILLPMIWIMACVVYRYHYKMQERFWSVVYGVFVITHTTILGQFVLRIVAVQSVDTSGTVTGDALLYLFLSTAYGLITIRIERMLNKLCNAINNSIVYEIMKRTDALWKIDI
eukprot:398857_1